MHDPPLRAAGQPVRPTRMHDPPPTPCALLGSPCAKQACMTPLMRAVGQPVCLSGDGVGLTDVQRGSIWMQATGVLMWPSKGGAQGLPGRGRGSSAGQQREGRLRKGLAVKGRGLRAGRQREGQQRKGLAGRGRGSRASRQREGQQVLPCLPSHRWQAAAASCTVLAYPFLPMVAGSGRGQHRGCQPPSPDSGR